VDQSHRDRRQAGGGERAADAQCRADLGGDGGARRDKGSRGGHGGVLPVSYPIWAARRFDFVASGAVPPNRPARSPWRVIRLPRYSSRTGERRVGSAATGTDSRGGGCDRTATAGVE